MVRAFGSNHAALPGKSQVALASGPEHAAQIANDGCGRRHVQRYIFENARIRLDRLQAARLDMVERRPPWMRQLRDPGALVPAVRSPDDVMEEFEYSRFPRAGVNLSGKSRPVAVTGYPA